MPDSNELGPRMWQPEPASVWAVFDHERSLLAAVRDVRRHGLEILDIYSPYAIHGLEHRAGFRRSRLHRVALCFGSLGVLTAVGLQFWTTAVSWPLDIGNKPWNSWPAFLPVTFELMVLCAGVGTVLVFLGLSRLWPGRRAVLPFAGLTNDRFALGVMAPESESDPDDTAWIEQLLCANGALEIVAGTTREEAA